MTSNNHTIDTLFGGPLTLELHHSGPDGYNDPFIVIRSVDHGDALLSLPPDGATRLATQLLHLANQANAGGA
jgi:hypothetical protein